MLFGSSVGLPCRTSNLEALRKPVNTDRYNNGSPHVCAGDHYAFFVFTYEISQVSKLQDKHNASILYFLKSNYFSA